jgi:hydroxymethylbilane synthase
MIGLSHWRRTRKTKATSLSHSHPQTLMRVGTRGSDLALAQAHQVRDRLSDLHADSLDVKVEIIRTTGDDNLGPLAEIGGEGVFTAQLERALLDGRVDVAVHSLKDLPTQLHPELELVATPERADVRDVLIAAEATSIETLAENARLGSGSLRRQCQVLALRPDLRFIAVRGNIGTRIAQAREGVVDGVLLAAAGLHRLGLEHEISCYLDTNQVLPAPGQAAIGLEMRQDDPLINFLRPLNHAATLASVIGERSLLEALGGGCRAPIASWGRVVNDELLLDGLVGSTDGVRLIRESVVGAPADAHDCGLRLAAELIRKGAHSLLPS